MTRLTQEQRRAVSCPACGRGAGRPCVSSRIPSPSTLGGGWGGPPDLNREHKERVDLARARVTTTATAKAACEQHQPVSYTSDGALGHGWECGRCGVLLQVG